jgi:hypothetical protein
LSNDLPGRFRIVTPQSQLLISSGQREEGPNIIQDFHEGLTVRAGKLYAIIADVCAFANANGGTLYIGLLIQKPAIGVPDPEQAIVNLEKEIDKRISPPCSALWMCTKRAVRKFARYWCRAATIRPTR